MIEKNTLKKFTLSIVSLLAFLFTFNTNAQHCVGNQITLTLDNITATENTIEYDVFLKNTGTTQLKLSAFGGNVLYGANLLPPGATGTIEVVDQPSVLDFPGINTTTVTTGQSEHTVATRQLRWTFNPIIPREVAPLLAYNVNYKFARFRFTSSIPWDLNTESSLMFSTIPTGGVALNVPVVFCNQNIASASISVANGNLVLNVGGENGNEGAHISMFRLLSTATAEGNLPTTAFPNPFGENFQLHCASTSEDLITIKVYDMIGKLIEERQVIASELSKQAFGNSYQTGLYNVVLSKEEQQQTIRVIKK